MSNFGERKEHLLILHPIQRYVFSISLSRTVFTNCSEARSDILDDLLIHNRSALPSCDKSDICDNRYEGYGLLSLLSLLSRFQGEPAL
jgi:hypothetical protein